MQVMKSPGGYRFLPIEGPFSGAPFSAGVAAEPGHKFVRVLAPRETPLADGFRLVEQTLDAAGRPLAALCATELRVPAPMTRQGFTDFNRGYIDQLERWGLPLDGHSPVARTNVAPELDPPSQACMHAFCYTVQGDHHRPTFVISGSPEAPGTEGGLAGFWADMLKTMDERIAALGLTWADATETQFYGPRAAFELFGKQELARFEDITRPGLRWVFSLPPIDDLNLEVDVRGIASESWL